MDTVYTEPEIVGRIGGRIERGVDREPNTGSVVRQERTRVVTSRQPIRRQMFLLPSECLSIQHYS